MQFEMSDHQCDKGTRWCSISMAVDVIQHPRIASLDEGDNRVLPMNLHLSECQSALEAIDNLRSQAVAPPYRDPSQISGVTYGLVEVGFRNRMGGQCQFSRPSFGKFGDAAV